MLSPCVPNLLALASYVYLSCCNVSQKLILHTIKTKNQNLTHKNQSWCGLYVVMMCPSYCHELSCMHPSCIYDPHLNPLPQYDIPDIPEHFKMVTTHGSYTESGSCLWITAMGDSRHGGFIICDLNHTHNLGISVLFGDMCRWYVWVTSIG